MFYCKNLICYEITIEDLKKFFLLKDAFFLNINFQHTSGCEQNLGSKTKFQYSSSYYFLKNQYLKTIRLSTGFF